MKIVFMPMLPLIKRDYEYLGIKYFVEKSYDVFILETHQILIPEYKSKVNLEYIDLPNLIHPKDVKELIEFVRKLDEEDVILFYLAGKDSVLLLNLLKKITKAKFATYVSGSIPSSSNPCKFIDLLKRRIMPSIRRIQYSLGFGVFESDFYFTGSPKDELVYPYLCYKNTKKIKIHSRDYDECINVKSYINETNYCVFLDTDVINASDYELFNNNVDQNRLEDYHNKLILFFNYIKSNLGIDVIISAHPKSRVYKGLNNFKGFKVEHNKSAELVKGSAFVINEATTAISFAIYFNKPLLFFSMKEIDFFYNYACSYAKELKKEIILIDDLNDSLLIKIKLELANKFRYDYYKYTYLTYKDTNINNFSLIEQELFNGR